MALPGEEESTHELLNAQTLVWNHIFKFMFPMSLKCAIELNIPEIIKNHGKPMTLSELTTALPINKAKSHYIHRMMRVLVHSKFFMKVAVNYENEQNEGYWLTPSSRLLLKDSALSIAPLFLLIHNPILMKPCSSISEWFTDDRVTAFETAHGLKFWEQAKEDSSLTKLFYEAMAGDSRFVSQVILKDCKKLFSGVGSLVDVGGGTGNMAKAIADAFPEMKCTVLDLPQVVSGLEGSSNLNYVGGDMFEAIPTADVVLLKWLLHDWDDEACIKVLKNCREVIPAGKEKGGKVIIIDIVLGYNNENDMVKEDQLLWDIAMMVYLNGKERSEKEWKQLFLDAGFSSYNITPILGVRSIIEVYP
ncbi:trans-resveratrol di-O-methyltransferase [Dorcoceras hygrometricum]|uniref:Trans-resveratrol di-O-methyltransferase n=1 Tax=Dorcoceras hygrometricum TaxID=472368 RepID=A0A2Z7D805_9LAMI|nr:trans-resveratrol di-O-methyltransferase [Dorcoceras hygrometricum]